jgi:hypothetical protein
MGDWSVDSIEEGVEDVEEEEDRDTGRREHRRTDTDITIRPAISRDVFRDQGQSSTGVLSSSPEADPASTEPYSNPSVANNHLAPNTFRKPEARIRKQVSPLYIFALHLRFWFLIIR